MSEGQFLGALMLVALLGVLVACGGGGESADVQTAPPPEPLDESGQTLDDLLDAESGDDVAIV